MFSMDNKQQSVMRRNADTDVTRFVDRMMIVRKSDQERIIEDGLCFGKVNPMLLKILIGLLGIPFKE